MTTAIQNRPPPPPPPPAPNAPIAGTDSGAKVGSAGASSKGTGDTSSTSSTSSPAASSPQSTATKSQQAAARSKANAVEQSQKKNLNADAKPQPPIVARGLSSSMTAPILTGTDKTANAANKTDNKGGQNVDPKKQPIMILAPQYGTGKSDEIVKNSHDAVKAAAEKNGFKVIDAANLTGDKLKEKVKAEMPKGHTGPVVAWTGGHGAVVADKGEKASEHELSATDANGKTREARTAEDIIRPIFDGAKEKSGHDPKMTAFVGSCRAGETGNDVTDSFSKEEQKSLAVVTSSKGNQLSNGDGQKGVEAATIAFTDMMSKDSKARAKADVDKDGNISAGEFKNHVNKDGGGLAMAREKDLDGDQRPDVIELETQKVGVVGNKENTLIPKGIGVNGSSDEPGSGRTTATTKEEAKAQAKELQQYLGSIYGQTPKVVDNNGNKDKLDATYDASGKTIKAGDTNIRINDDGSKKITVRGKDGAPNIDETVDAGGKTGGYTVTDPSSGDVLAKAKLTFDAKGRSLTKSVDSPTAPWITSDKTTYQYDDKSKPTSTQVMKFKDGFTETTTNFNDPKNQSLWHDNDLATRVKTTDPRGKLVDVKSTFNRPDGDGKPFTIAKHTLIHPMSGKPMATASTSSDVGEPRTFTGKDGKSMTEANARRWFPQFFPDRPVQ